MRHRLLRGKFSRTSSHREAMFCNMSTSLFSKGELRTTLPKAKFLRPLVEKLITTAKIDNLSARRSVARFIKDDTALSILFVDIAVRLKSRNGGYCRIIKVGYRPGDKAPMAIIKFV